MRIEVIVLGDHWQTTTPNLEHSWKLAFVLHRT